MRNRSFKKLFILCLPLIISGCATYSNQSPGLSQAQRAFDAGSGTVLNEESLSELIPLFTPGLKVGTERVAKTFMPSFVVTGKGTLMVFAQGRLQRGGDNDPKVILMRRSEDSGQTWSDVQIISGVMNHFAVSPYTSQRENIERVSFIVGVGLKVTKEFYNNDYPAMKQATGIDINETGKDTAAVIMRFYSDDDGKSWKREVLLTERSPLYKKNDKGFTSVFINTIGQVHKIPEGPWAGRYIVAVPINAVPEGETITSNFRNHGVAFSGVIYSDDQGESWKMGGVTKDATGNEASAVSINQGRELLMLRRFGPVKRHREINLTPEITPQPDERIAHISRDGGMSWEEAFTINVSSHTCHGNLYRKGKRIYFTMPATPERGQHDDRLMRRSRGTIYFSDDEGQSWNSRMIEAGPYSYSSVGQLDDQRMITFFTRGYHGEAGIAYRIFTDSWLEGK